MSKSVSAPFAAVVLAAGLGKRMNSDLPKVLHLALGRPLVVHVLEQIDPLKPRLTVVVVGHRASLVQEALRGREVVFAEQIPQLGTGHAVQMAWSALREGPETLLVLAGDMPLIRTATLKRLLERHEREANGVTFLSGVLEDPSGYGRVIRDAAGGFVKIVEEKDATPAERAVAEVNSGIYCFSRDRLELALGFLRADNRQQEYYLTDTLSIIKGQGGRIGVEQASDSRELLGVNNPEQLAMVEEALRAWGAK
ncbi:MAG TPA: NTP transferase domain-containing protein [Candidatus Limnocylindrales bacterium]|nr:NTP transferase domain-containing protein [Candidatus Limnocylindrales bacterium]